MTLINISILFFSFLFLLLLFFYLIYGKLTEKKFDAIAEKFEKKFGYLPLPMIVGKHGGFFFWSYKELPIIGALFFTKFPATQKSLTKEEILFFKNLKKEDISWFYIKHISVAIGLLSFIILLLIAKFGLL